jgi:tetratricopeptide (TPR) repeat protein
MTVERTIRLYCPTHKTSFMISPEAKPVCEVGGHALAQKFPPEDFWEYCCDCQSFRPSEIGVSGGVQGRCMVCDREIARRFLCDGCRVISVESDESAKRRKPYMLDAAGAIEPECPACGREPRAAALHPHDCPEVETQFTTALESCPFCGQQVRPSSPPPSTVAAQSPSVTTAGQELVGFCGQCGRGYGNEATFCGGCGIMLPTHPDYKQPDSEQIGADFPPHQPPPQPDPIPMPSPSQGEGTFSPAKAVVAVIAVLVGMLVLVGIVTSVSTSNRNTSYNSANYYNSETTDSKLKSAISQNNLVSPTGSSAYDYYQQLRREGGSPSSYNEMLLPLLRQKPQQLLSDLYEPGGDDGALSDWEEAARMLEWAVEMSSSDTWLKSRAVYCRGRVAYLNKDSDEAQRLWQQASDLDKSWPVPVNGVGLIYNEHKEYAKAQPFFREALSRDSSWAVPYNNLGTSFRESGDTAQAYENYNKAVSLAPKWGRPHAWLGDMAMKDGNYSRAADEYKAVLDLVPVGTPGWNLDKVRQKYDAARVKAGSY